MGSEVRKGVVCESTAINLNVDALALETSAGPLVVSSLNILQGWYPKISMILSVCVLSCSVMSDSYDAIDCSLPDSSVHGILQARILEWVAITHLQGIFPDPGIKPSSLMSPALVGGFSTTRATWEAPLRS